MMLATATSPVPASQQPICPKAFRIPGVLWAVPVLVVGMAAIGPRLLPVALGLAVLMGVAAWRQRAMHERAPRRLVPIGLAPGLAVKLSGESLLVGRLPCCRVEIPLPTVSSHHCRLHRQGLRWHIEDLGSRNGTYVNDVRVRRKRIRVGDRISIGEFTFRVE